MKKLFQLPVLISFGMMVAGSGCSKESPIPPPPPKPVTSVGFKANGKSIEWDGPATSIFSSSIVAKGNGTFIFYVSDPENQMFSDLAITIRATNLTVGTYTLQIDTTVSLEYAPHSFMLTYSMEISYEGTYEEAASTDLGDFGTVIITSIHDANYADGTFSAILSEYNGNGPTGKKINITDGRFHNLVMYL
jgi:hypothetical protein